MPRKGGPDDNAVAENFSHALNASVYLNYFTTRSQAQNEIFRYIETFYNLVRPHSAIVWIFSNDFESLTSMTSKDTA
jgi:transposase InsO family protein